MKNFRLSAAGVALVMLELWMSQATAKQLKKNCTDSGLGGPICPQIVPGRLYLTDEQLQTIHQWNTDNLETVQNIKAMKK
jgi:hypothetical protein